MTHHKPHRRIAHTPPAMLLLTALASSAFGLPVAKARAEPPDKTIDVEESQDGAHKGGVFTIGAGFNHFEGFIGTAGVSHGSLFGLQGLELSLDASISALAQRVEVEFGGTQDLVGPLFWSVRAHHDDLRLTEDHPLRALQTGAEARLGAALDRRWTLTGGYRFTHHQLTEGEEVLGGALGGLAAFAEDPRQSVSALWVQLEYRSEPAAGDTLFIEGLHLTGRLERAFEAIGSEVDFTRAEARATYGLPLFWGVHLKLDARAGAVRADSADQVPLMERFRLGVPHSFGGNWLLPTGPDLDVGGAHIPLGGTEAAAGSAQLHIPLIPSAGVFAFGGIEGGAVQDRLGGRADLDWNATAFGGLRWFSPIGPLSFGWGAPLGDGLLGQEPMFFFQVGGGL